MQLPKTDDEEVIPNFNAKILSVAAAIHPSTTSLFKKMGITEKPTRSGFTLHEGVIPHEHYIKLSQHLKNHGYDSHKGSAKIGYFSGFVHSALDHHIQATPDLSSYSIGTYPNWKIRSVQVHETKASTKVFDNKTGLWKAK